MIHIPFILVLSRIFIALIIAIITFTEFDLRELSIALLIIAGLLTDLFDGIIARKLNIATEKLRVWDSNVDLFFWIVSISAVFYLNFHFLKSHLIWIILITSSELLVYLICFYKFKRPVATHTYLAKFWTLTLLCFMIELVLTADSKIIFILCCITGLISRIEIIVIMLRLKSWKTDVPSVFALKRINKQ